MQTILLSHLQFPGTLVLTAGLPWGFETWSLMKLSAQEVLLALFNAECSWGAVVLCCANKSQSWVVTAYKYIFGTTNSSLIITEVEPLSCHPGGEDTCKIFSFVSVNYWETVFGTCVLFVCFFFQCLAVLLHRCLVCIVSHENSSVTFISVPLCKTFFPWLPAALCYWF